MRPLAVAEGPARTQLGHLARRFSHSDGAEAVLDGPRSGLHIVTGFGPTNAPTAGTLSVMLGVVELQRQLGAEMTVVVSELGAWNSRNVPWAQLEGVRDQMLGFLRVLGFDEPHGRLRSHLDFGNLARAGKIARFLTREDFLAHREELLELYADHGLLGSEIGLTVDALYTVADILGPAEAGATRTLMVSGVEEAYFAALARLVLERQAMADELSLGWRSTIGALYFRVLPGLGGYPKMSKSIPASAIHLGMPVDELRARIRSDAPEDQAPLLTAMELASGWQEDRLAVAREVFAQRARDVGEWHRLKEDYLVCFLEFAERWRACA
ncbi:MAG: hypothetical protein ACRDYA_09430 [Egibacteraceae bacterium]